MGAVKVTVQFLCVCAFLLGIFTQSVAENLRGTDHLIIDSSTRPTLQWNTLDSRVSSLHLKAEHFFGPPKTENGSRLFRVGVNRFLTRYPQQTEESFRGYVLYQDPYDLSTDTVSFLMGSDCSHFVQRLYELMGASYPYAKTRNFIHLKLAHMQGLSADVYYHEQINKGVPITMPLAEWLDFANSFKIINGGDLKPGDLIIIPKTIGKYGRRGHVMMVNKTKPLEVIHSKDKDAGIVNESFDLSAHPELFFYRYAGGLSNAFNPADLLNKIMAR